MSLPSVTFRLSEQPTLHCEQAEVTISSARPAHLLSFSVMAPTGQTSTQRPQKVQPDSASVPPWAVPTMVSLPRISKVMALTPSISSQARTHFPQTMQRFMS